MFNYLLRRLNLLFITGFILTVITFTVTYWSTYQQSSDSNYIIDYFNYITEIIQGNWGLSSIDQQPILIKGRYAFLSTLQLCLLTVILAHVVAIPMGIIAAFNRNRVIDHIIMVMVLIGLALPVFWLAIITTMFSPLIMGSSPAIPLTFDSSITSGSILVDVLPTSDSYTLQQFLARLSDLLLPSAVMSVFLISEITRLTRLSITKVMKSNYVKAAYAKGLSNRQIVFNHVIKNALPAIIHQIRLHLSSIISIAMVVEIVFSIQGTGTWLVNSINKGDYIALPTAILLISGFILITSIFTDILLVSISPVKRKSLYVD